MNTDASTFPKRYRPGDVVSVLYRASRPGAFVVDRFGPKWVPPAVVTGAGLVLSVPALVVAGRVTVVPRWSIFRLRASPA